MNDQVMGTGRGGMIRPPSLTHLPPSLSHTLTSMGGQSSDIGALYTQHMQQRVSKWLKTQEAQELSTKLAAKLSKKNNCNKKEGLVEGL